jgi:hypothetical protein
MESITVSIDKKGDKTHCSNYRGISLFSTAYKILSIILLSRLHPYADEITGDHQCGTGQLLIINYAFANCMRIKWNTMKQCINYL